MKPINILWIVDHLGYDGVMHGAGKYYLSTIPFFDSNKFNVTLYALRDKDHLTKLFEKAGIKVRHLAREKFDIRAIADIFKIMKQGHFDLIHTHGYASDDFGRVSAKILDIPIIIHTHDENINYPFYQNVADLILKPFTNKAIAVSGNVKTSCSIKRRINEKNISIFHNGIQLEHYVNQNQDLISEQKNKFGIKPDSIIIGSVGRLRIEKGIKYLIEAAPKILNVFPNVVFFIAGDGPQREDLKSLAKELKVEDNIIFAGFCYDIPAVLSIIDIFVSPSLTEGSPQGILEAMALMKPIVATNVGGVKEILIDNKTGLLIPSKNPEALAEKVINLLKDESKQQELSKNAAEEVKNYDVKKYVKKLGDFYLEILGK
ncbi:MAG: glycosyltransferase family 4 protein [Ignavibacteriales bacterium]|nr:glycosyltransferase family 4 protein [Ignavibacteriales bacterium]MCB9211009.1 glycosyltransferase family 4 protein [Ignavibacteriales bacterium]